MGSSTCLRLFYGNFHFTAETYREFEAAIELDEVNEHTHADCCISEDYSRYDGLQHTIAACKRLGIPYQLHAFDDCEFNYISWWKPGMAEPIEVDRSVDGSPMVSFSSLIDHYNDGTIAQLLERQPDELNPATFDDVCVLNDIEAN